MLIALLHIKDQLALISNDGNSMDAGIIRTAYTRSVSVHCVRNSTSVPWRVASCVMNLAWVRTEKSTGWYHWSI